MSGRWTQLVHQPPFPLSACGAMLLLTDGSVMCNQESSATWCRLVPDAYGDYATGTWLPAAPMAYARAFFPAAVLADGRLFVAGGEYSGPPSQVGNLASNDLAAAEIYEPSSDTWTRLPLPTCPNGTPWSHIGDVPCCVLPTGQILLGCLDAGDGTGCPTATARFDPASQTWQTAASKTVPSGEETWTLLHDGTVLTVDPYAANLAPAPVPNRAVKYLPLADQWVSAGTVPVELVQEEQPGWQEIGPAIALPDGRVFAIGATGHTAVYTPPTRPHLPGQWTVGPDFPADGHGGLMGAADAPACLLPSGNVLCIVGAQQRPNTGPVRCFEYDGVGLESVDTPGWLDDHDPNNLTVFVRLLVLPSGQILFGHKTAAMGLYTPDGAGRHDCRPRITRCPRHFTAGQTAIRVDGYRLNGVSQGASYGDDAAMATNYPLVRLTQRHARAPVVYYCRTHDHSTMGISRARRRPHAHSFFDVPSHVMPGAYKLEVVVNGIPSEPLHVSVT